MEGVKTAWGCSFFWKGCELGGKQHKPDGEEGRFEGGNRKRQEEVETDFREYNHSNGPVTNKICDDKSMLQRSS